MALAVVAPLVAVAEESPTEDKFNLNVRRIGLDWTKTSIHNPGEYQNSTVAALKASDQENIQGVFDVALEYGVNRFKWDNSLFMEYGKQSIKPYKEPRSVDESADKILLSSDLAYACWDFDSFKLGPIVRGQYETEFKGNPRRNVLRPNGLVSGASIPPRSPSKSLPPIFATSRRTLYSGNKSDKIWYVSTWSAAF